MPKGTAPLEEVLLKTVLVIPSVNGGDLLERMLPSLNVPSQIVYILDQGSTDNTIEICETYGANVVQLDTKRTYTECCNLALKIAKDRSAEFFFVANNDIVLTSDVCRELLREMLEDKSLGILSCSQLVADQDLSNTILSNRVYWDLSCSLFEHDTEIKRSDYKRLESDFCELTFAIMRTEAVTNVGGFDDGFGFYHEDADLGFRMREKGYSTAYLPQSQIIHFAGSTFRKGMSDERLQYIERSKTRFASKHLGYGADYSDYGSDIPSSWTIVNRNLYANLSKMGMVDHARPSLVFAHPGEKPFEFLFSVWETSRLPAQWLKYRDSYKAVFVPSRWNERVFSSEGFHNVSYVPLGVDTDVFHPWGSVNRFYDEPTFLWFSRNQYRKGLDVMLEAWATFRTKAPKAWLVILGHDILSAKNISKIQARRWREFAIFDDLSNHVSYREIVTPLSDERVAEIYRSVDTVVVTSRSEGFGFNIVEALSCGTMTVFPAYGATEDMIFDGALTFSGAEVEANYSDKLFYNVGTWWEPHVSSVIRAMNRSIDLNTIEREQIVRNGRNLVTSSFTWRKTSFALREALMRVQLKRDSLHQRLRSDWNSDIRHWIVNRLENSLIDFNILDRVSIDEIFRDFDSAAYVEANPDIAVQNVDPLWHFIVFGWLEGRNVTLRMNTKRYIASSQDILMFFILISGFGLVRPDTNAREIFFRWELDLVSREVASEPLSDIAFIMRAYRMLLRRLPDADGVKTFAEFLAHPGNTRQKAAESIYQSDEAIERRSRSSSL